MLTELLMGCVIVGIAFHFVRSNLKRKNIPPGPWGLPILGHLPFLGSNPSITFLKWSQIYGPIFSVRFGSTPAVVLNDAKLIKEALSLEATAGRPLLTNFVQIFERKGILFADGPGHSEQRKFVLKSFKDVGLAKSEFEFRVQEEISLFLSKLKLKCRINSMNKKPMLIKFFFRFPVINAFWVAMLGKRFEENDPTLHTFFEIMEESKDTNSSLVVQISWFLSWVARFLSFLGLNRCVSGIRKIFDYIESQIEQCRGDHVAGQPRNFTHAYFDQVAQTTDPNSSFFEGKQQRMSTGDIFLGATDTTNSTLDWLLLYMARESEIQGKLQAEIDAVLGTKENRRTPSVSDRGLMPYTEAVIQELLRISSIVPLGVFHRAMQDLNFHGYVIPKDTMVITNLYGVHRDPRNWPDPDAFIPERFLDDSGKLKKAPGEFIPFGFGKRSCIGEGFARDQLFLMCTSFFQQFSISCTHQIPSLELKFGFALAPNAFQLYITER